MNGWSRMIGVSSRRCFYVLICFQFLFSTICFGTDIDPYNPSLTSVEDFEQFQTGSLREARKNLITTFFGFIGRFFECTLGLAIFSGGIFDSPCICQEGSLRPKISSAQSSSIVSFFQICKDAEVRLTGAIDMTDRNFVLACEIKETGNCRISGRGLNPIFTGAPTFGSFFDLTLTNGAASNGGLMHLTGGTTVIARSALRDSKATGSGGAIHMTGTHTTLNILGCNVTDNQANEAGGAIHVDAVSGIVQLSGTTRSRVSSNSARIGGAVAIIGGKSIVAALLSDFSDNQSKESGGAFYLENGVSITVSESSLNSNSAGASGGAVYAFQQSAVIMERVVFVQNTAMGNGGAIAVLNSKAVLDPKTAEAQVGFHSNKATGTGDDLAIVDDENPVNGGTGSYIDCRTVNSNQIIFCDGIGSGIFDAGDGFDNTNCDTQGKDGPLAGGNLFCPSR